MPLELAKEDHASVDFRAGQLLTTHEEEVEMCGFLISWTSCPAALISPDHPSLSLSGAGAIWKLHLKVKHTASVQQTLHRWYLRASKCSVVYNLQSPVFPVMALPMALLQPCHRNQSNQLLQPIATPHRNTNCHPVATHCHLATPLEHLNFCPGVATPNMFWCAGALMEGNCTKADLLLAPFREVCSPDNSNRSHPPRELTSFDI